MDMMRQVHFLKNFDGRIMHFDTRISYLVSCISSSGYLYLNTSSIWCQKYAISANYPLLNLFQLVPHHIHVVSELREYPGWKEHQLDSNTGIIGARKELAKLHQRLAEEGFTEIYVDQLNVDCVAITRHCPKDRR